jgi:hypothetical protein
MLWVAYLDGGSEGAARIGRRLPSQARGTRRQRRFHPRRAARNAGAETPPPPGRGEGHRGRDDSIPNERQVVVTNPSPASGKRHSATTPFGELVFFFFLRECAFPSKQYLFFLMHGANVVVWLRAKHIRGSVGFQMDGRDTLWQTLP